MIVKRRNSCKSVPSLVARSSQKRPILLDRNETKVEYEVVSTLTDRSSLSDDMASMCAKLPIYGIEKPTPFSVMVKRKCYFSHCGETPNKCCQSTFSFKLRCLKS